MPFVARDGQGRIVAIYAAAREGAREQLSADDPELQKFIGASHDDAGARERLLESDLQLVRVLEDLIDVLIAKRVILFTDLPPVARAKLGYRRGLREKLADLGGIMEGADEVMLP
jgi:hypothetical protein